MENTSDEQEGKKWIPAKEAQGKKDIPFNDKNCNNSSPPQVPHHEKYRLSKKYTLIVLYENIKSHFQSLPFQEAEDIFLISKKIYKVSASVNLMAKKIDSVNRVVDSGTESSLSWKHFLKVERLRAIQVNDVLFLMKATS